MLLRNTIMVNQFDKKSIGMLYRNIFSTWTCIIGPTNELEFPFKPLNNCIKAEFINIRIISLLTPTTAI